jgi:hypothetical protein
MEKFLEIKRRRVATNAQFRQLSAGRSQFPRFNTTQHVTRFILENLGADPEYELGLILRPLIDAAYENARREYGREATRCNILIEGQNLTQPISVTLSERIPGLDIEIVS